MIDGIDRPKVLYFVLFIKFILLYLVTVVHVCSAPKSTHCYFLLDLKSMKKIIKGLQQYTLIFFLHCCHTLVKQFFYCDNLFYDNNLQKSFTLIWVEFLKPWLIFIHTIVVMVINQVKHKPCFKKVCPGARFSKVPKLFGWQKSLCIFNRNTFHALKLCSYSSVFFKFLSSRSFVKSRRLWVHLLDIFRLCLDSWSNESSWRNLAEKPAAGSYIQPCILSFLLSETY